MLQKRSFFDHFYSKTPQKSRFSHPQSVIDVQKRRTVRGIDDGIAEFVELRRHAHGRKGLAKICGYRNFWGVLGDFGVFLRRFFWDFWVFLR
jgi:hypothetical protein